MHECSSPQHSREHVLHCNRHVAIEAALSCILQIISTCQRSMHSMHVTLCCRYELYTHGFPDGPPVCKHRHLPCVSDCEADRTANWCLGLLHLDKNSQKSFPASRSHDAPATRSAASPAMPQAVRVLNVSEKPSVAKEVSRILSNGSARQGQSW